MSQGLALAERANTCIKLPKPRLKDFDQQFIL
jgi:hypothetical protein